ncbi:hypothetical protein [Paenibacillus sp. 453mf]|uniref:hypothetical protein n=1 Tax=Paenibacillus sp. 453mf TaxID=1761874 RepID=UPI001113AEC7|nr:hypothetical protein [Paenibacillus sp. 453mf]
MENIGVDDSQRRSTFEKQLKASLEEVQRYLIEDTEPKEKYYLLAFSGFLGYGYMLRQLGDYDSLFDMKTSKKDIINWTIVTSNFFGFVVNYLNESTNESSNKIQKLDAISSPEIISLGHLDTDTMAMTLTGIIIDYAFNFVNVIKNLYLRQGYSMLNHKGIVSSFTSDSTEITIYKMISVTPLECYITISNQGIFRIDVRITGTRNQESFKEAINHYYLEKYIEYDILEKDLMVSVSERALLVRGIPTTYGEHMSFNYIELLSGIHPSVDHQIHMRIRRALSDLDEASQVEDVLTRSFFSSNLSEDSLSMRIRTILRRREEYIGKSRIVLIIFSSTNIISNLEESLARMKNKFNEQITGIQIHIEQVYLSESDVRQILVKKDYSKLEFSINELKKMYLNQMANVPAQVQDIIQENPHREELFLEEEVN